MSQSNTLFLGMDVHKDTIAVAYVPQDHGAEVTSLGSVGTHQGDLAQLDTHNAIQSATSPLHLRSQSLWLLALPLSDQEGVRCWVVAPSLIPKKPGDRVTTDRRDAVPLARLARSGISPPSLSPGGR